MLLFTSCHTASGSFIFAACCLTHSCFPTCASNSVIHLRMSSWFVPFFSTSILSLLCMGRNFRGVFNFTVFSILCEETIYIIPVLRDKITYIISVMCEETTSRGLCLPYMILYSQFKLCHQFLLPVLHANAWEVLFSPTQEKIKRTSSGDNPHSDLGMRLASGLLARKGGAGAFVPSQRHSPVCLEPAERSVAAPKAEHAAASIPALASEQKGLRVQLCHLLITYTAAVRDIKTATGNSHAF